MKLNQIILGIFCTLCTAKAWAIHTIPGEHWFEIEVILFSQIGDKTTLKETFKETTELPNYRRTLDLLTPYLQPDIKSLKQLLPYCDSPTYPLNMDYASLNEAQLKAQYHSSVNISLKALNNIRQEALIVQNSTSIQKNDLDSTLSNKLTDVVNDQEDDFYRRVSQVQGTNSANISTLNKDDAINTTLPAYLSEEQLALVAEAEQTFAPEHNRKITLLSPKSLAKQPLCVWSPEYYANLKAATPSLPPYNGALVPEVSGQIDGVEKLYSDSAYLIAKDSLQLSDINKQLSLSKDFKPLLHFGWRQSTLNQKKAIPLKVFSGDNLMLNYEAALQQREKDLALSLAQEQNILTLLNVNNEADRRSQENNNAIIETKEQIIGHRIQEIIEQISQAPTDLSTLINEEEIPLLESDELLISPPEKPAQPWYLDGFIKVHVEHYLHVTAGFNIMNKTLAEQKAINSKANTLNQTSNPIEIKPISFKQDRRVISGEVHYFDHPYLGMVLQIRRYQKPELPHDEESEHTH